MKSPGRSLNLKTIYRVPMYTHTLFARFLNPLGCLRCRSTCRIAILSMGQPRLLFSTVSNLFYIQYIHLRSPGPVVFSPPGLSSRSNSQHLPNSLPPIRRRRVSSAHLVSKMTKYFNTNRSEIDQRLSPHDGYSSQVLDAVLQPLNKCSRQRNYPWKVVIERRKECGRVDR